MEANQMPQPNRHPRLPLGSSVWFDYLFCAPPAFPAAVGKARRWAAASHIYNSFTIHLRAPHKYLPALWQNEP